MRENQVKPRFNVIDLVIILAVIALIVTAVLRSGITNEIQRVEANEKAEISVVVEGVSATIAEAFRDGEILYCSQTGEKLGTLNHFDAEPYVSYRETVTGEWVKTESTTLVTLRGTITCTGSRAADGSFLLNGTRFISAGSSFAFRSNTTEASLTVLSLSILQ